VVRGTAGIELLKKPQALLGKREWRIDLVFTPCNRMLHSFLIASSPALELHHEGGAFLR
jgi:hypothetical protein